MLKVLIVKLSSLGDVVHAMPAVQDIRRAWPQAQVDWVVEPAFADLVRRCEGVGRVIECHQRQWRRTPLAATTREAFGRFRAELRAIAYDAVIDLQGLTKSAVVSRLARLAPGGLRHALAHATDGSSYEVPTRWVADRVVGMPRRIHAVDRSRVLCAHALGYRPDGPEVFGLRCGDGAAGLAGAITDDRDDRREVVLVHGTSRADKLWPEAHWVDLGRRLLAQGHRLGLPHGSDEEQQRAQRLADALGDGPGGYEVFGPGCGDGAEGLVAGGDTGERDDRREVVLVHGTSRADKLWPEAHWIDLGRRLLAQGHRLGLPHGSDEEQQRAQRLADALGAAASVWPRLPLGALADRMAGCRGVIGVDSGLSHIATALDRPHVQVYNHDTAWRTGPVGRARQVSVFAAPAPSVDAVWQAWVQVSAATLAESERAAPGGAA